MCLFLILVCLLCKGLDIFTGSGAGSALRQFQFDTGSYSNSKDINWFLFYTIIMRLLFFTPFGKHHLYKTVFKSKVNIEKMEIWELINPKS